MMMISSVVTGCDVTDCTLKVYKSPDDGKKCLKLCEFGLAIEVGNHLLHDLCGTPMYMSPEIVKKTG